MTHEQNQSSPLPELRIKVAQLRGWSFPDDLPSCKAQMLGFYKDEPECRTIPHLTLDEMNEAEKMLLGNDVLYVAYCKALAKKCSGLMNACRATPKQRAEAFIAIMEATP